MELNLIALIRSLMTDLSISDLDSEYVLRRLASEGITFLTVELPKVSKAILRALEIGSFTDVRADALFELTSFRFKGATLQFLGELINQVFCRHSGRILPFPNGAAVGIIRQLCEYSYKLALQFTKEQEKNALENFVQNEADLKALSHNEETLRFAEELRKDFESHWGEISSVGIHSILGSYRPRSTSGTYVGSGRFFYIDKQSTGSNTVPSDSRAFEGYYKPYEGIGSTFQNDRYLYRRPERKVRLTSVLEPSFSELLFVHKDSRGPRTICREALKRVETQMAYFDFMVDKLTMISGGAINFKDQQVNRLIAEESSVSKTYATLDLKDASDRVSYRVCRTIFRNSTGISWFFTGSRRATKVKVDSITSPLYKVAGMGSGLTFPTMSLVISLAICNRVKKRTGLRYDEIRKRVFVYGDDICIPTQWVETAMRALSLIGLKVNENKSFFRGPFRESCGADFVAGIDVTPCRLKLTNSGASVDTLGRLKLADNANSFQQLYEHSKELFKKGLLACSRYCMSVLDRWYFRTFGIHMVAGAFDAECSLPLNFFKETKHLAVDGVTTLYTIRPEQVGLNDDYGVIDENGRDHKLCPYKHMGRVLQAISRTRSEASEEAVYNLNKARTDPGRLSEFGDVTIPRRLIFAKTKMINQFHLKNYVAKTRHQWMEKINREKFGPIWYI